MLKKVFGIVLILAFTATAFADGEKDRTPSKIENKGVIQDSTDSEDIHKIKIQTDDTLVFEDWDSSEDDYSGPTVTPALEDESELDVPQGQASEVPEAHQPISEPAVSSALSIYPNPVVDRINIAVDSAPNSLQIIGLNGEIRMQSTAVSSLDVSGLAKGIYFIQLVYDDTIETKKFVKQ